jgi:hypothetical protein
MMGGPDVPKREWEDVTGVSVWSFSVGAAQDGNCIHCGKGLPPGTRYVELLLPDNLPAKSLSLPANVKLRFRDWDHLGDYLSGWATLYPGSEVGGLYSRFVGFKPHSTQLS